MIPPFISRRESLESVISSEDRLSSSSDREEPRVGQLRKARSLSGRAELVRDIVLELVSGRDDPSSPGTLRKAASDPARAFFFHKERLPYQLKQGIQLDRPKNVHSKSLIKKLYAQYPMDPFVLKVAEKTSSDVFMLKRENLTHPHIASPQKNALEGHVQAYKEKYGISIHLATLDTFVPLMHELERTVPKPSYVSFIIGETAEALESGHVTPLLCSFGVANLECLIMDVLGGRVSSVKALRSELVRFTRRKNIIIAKGDRQIDVFSCRTDALSLLRNAHLSLRFHDFHEGLIQPLKTLLNTEEIDSDDTELPGEWNYIEQSFSGDERSLAIRDLFSSHIEKKEHPRTVDLFRRQHTEEVRFSCTLSNASDYQADFAGLAPPPGIRATINDQGFQITFEILSSVNTYLLHKGFLRAGLERKR